MNYNYDKHKYAELMCWFIFGAATCFRLSTSVLIRYVSVDRNGRNETGLALQSEVYKCNIALPCSDF